MTRHRFTITDPLIQGDRLLITDKEQVHQLTRVLRAKEGMDLDICDGQGTVYQVKVVGVGKKEIEAEVLKTTVFDALERKVVLCFGYLKGPRNEFIFEKATELGVTDFQPVLFDRCQPQSLTPNKLRRYHHIVQEAMEQSEGVWMPRIHQPVTLTEALESSAGARCLVALERKEDAVCSMQKEAGDIWLFVGPEGGFTSEEVAQFGAADVSTVTLGSRILRAETAVIVLLAKAL